MVHWDSFSWNYVSTSVYILINPCLFNHIVMDCSCHFVLLLYFFVSLFTMNLLCRFYNETHLNSILSFIHTSMFLNYQNVH